MITFQFVPFRTYRIKQFINEIITPMNPALIIVDPEATNKLAIHVYEKAGFKKTKLVEATDGSQLVIAQLMELDQKPHRYG